MVLNYDRSPWSLSNMAGVVDLHDSLMAHSSVVDGIHPSIVRRLPSLFT